MSVRGDTLNSLVQTASVRRVVDITNMPMGSKLYVQLRLRQNDGVLAIYTFFLPRVMVVEHDNRVFALYMGDEFCKQIKEAVLE